MRVGNGIQVGTGACFAQGLQGHRAEWQMEMPIEQILSQNQNPWGVPRRASSLLTSFEAKSPRSP